MLIRAASTRSKLPLMYIERRMVRWGEPSKVRLGAHLSEIRPIDSFFYPECFRLASAERRLR